MTQGSAQLPRPGDMIAGKYVLDRLLGQGGMGAVFAARHLKLSKAVAIKVMLADTSNPEASQRFINEGRAAANIQNEHVVRVDDVDEEMGYAYMVLELLEGRDLAQLLEAEPAKRLPPNIVVGYVIQALRGVAQAHALGIVHRDLKPSNLFLAKRKDGSDVVKVLDFGISKATGNVLGQAPNALTSTKAMLGSPLYMSPEQLRNAKGVDHRADIWAMGIILYELMTGALPFMGDNLGELFAAILESDPQPLSQRVPGIPPGLDEVVLRCLARKPEGRYASVAELGNALAPFERPMPGLPGPGMAMGAGTAFLPGGVQTGPQQQRPPGSVQTGPGLPPHAAMTPPNQFVQTPPQGNAPGAHPGQAMPPGFNNTTGSGWQAGQAAGVPKSKGPIIAIVAFVVMALLGIFAMAYVKLRGVDEHKPPVSAGSGQPPASASTIPTAAATPTVAVSTPPPASQTAATPSATPTAETPTPPTTTVATHSNPPTVHPPPPPPPPPPPTTTKPTSGKPTTPQMENAR